MELLLPWLAAPRPSPSTHLRWRSALTLTASQSQRCRYWLAGLLEQLAEQVAIEPGDREPLRTARRSRNDVDILGAQAALTDDPIGLGACQQGERTHDSS